MKTRAAIDIFFRGFSQVMLQENALTGAFFLFGIALNSLEMAAGASLGVIIGTLAASMLRFNEKEVARGLYGFNACLAGIACVAFLDTSAWSIAVLVLAAALSTLVTKKLLEARIKPFTAPFVVATWVVLALAFLFGVEIPAAPLQSGGLDVFAAASTGFSQVMLQNNAATGVTFALGVAVSSPFAFLYGLIGSLSGALAALALAQSFSVANAGLLGFNAVLCGIAFAGTRLAAPRKIVFALAAIALSIALSFAALAYGFPALTAPFVIATWVALALNEKIGTKKGVFT